MTSAKTKTAYHGISLVFVSGAKQRELTAISTSTGYNAYSSGIPSQTVYTILMSLDRSYERFGEHPVHLGRGDRPCILSSLGERVEGRIQISLQRMRCCRAEKMLP
jgi:hypothetical protein